MNVKVYRVVPKKNKNGVFYMVDAPSKRIAKWCGANLFNNEYIDFLSAKDMIAERFKAKEGRFFDLDRRIYEIECKLKGGEK